MIKFEFEQASTLTAGSKIFIGGRLLDGSERAYNVLILTAGRLYNKELEEVQNGIIISPETVAYKVPEEIHWLIKDVRDKEEKRLQEEGWDNNIIENHRLEMRDLTQLEHCIRESFSKQAQELYQQWYEKAIS